MALWSRVTIYSGSITACYQKEKRNTTGCTALETTRTDVGHCVSNRCCYHQVSITLSSNTFIISNTLWPEFIQNNEPMFWSR